MEKCLNYKKCEPVSCPSKLDKSSFAKLIGIHIIKTRKEKGWSQAEFSRRCNKDRQAIERIENGKIIPNSYTIYELATALEIDACELFNFCY